MDQSTCCLWKFHKGTFIATGSNMEKNALIYWDKLIRNLYEARLLMPAVELLLIALTKPLPCADVMLLLINLIDVVRAHFRNFWLGKAFFSRIWHAVVLTQFGNADSKSAPCQAIFCVFPIQNSKTKRPPKLVKMSQLYITAWLTMNIKTSFRCIKTHLSNILKVPWISTCAFAARGENPKWPPLQGNVL